MQNPATELPQRINAMKIVSYDVQTIAEALMAEQKLEAHEITLEMIMDRVETWVDEDFTTQGNVSDVIYQDENGQEIDA